MSVFKLIQSDLYRFGGDVGLKVIVKTLLSNNRSFKYTFWLRLCGSKNVFIGLVARYMHRHLSNKYQIQIPKETVIGPGLYLGHATTVVVSSAAIIGKNCNLSHFVNIGSNHGKAACIGDDVYIGPNVCIVDFVRIGDCVTIGAGSVVVKDIGRNATAVGVPSKIVNYEMPAQFIKNRWQ